MGARYSSAKKESGLVWNNFCGVFFVVTIVYTWFWIHTWYPRKSAGSAAVLGAASTGILMSIVGYPFDRPVRLLIIAFGTLAGLIIEKLIYDLFFSKPRKPS